METSSSVVSSSPEARVAGFFSSSHVPESFPTILVSPHAIFDTPPPPHPSAPAAPRLDEVKRDEVLERPDSPTSRVVPSITEIGIKSLQETLRYLHKRKVPWPADESPLGSLSPEQYLFHLLSPVVNVFNALRPRSMLNHPMRLEAVTVDTCVAFHATVLERYGREGLPKELKALVVLLQPGPLLDASQQPLPHVVAAAHNSRPEKDHDTSIIITNLSDILIFRWDLRSEDASLAHERVQASLPALALRGVVMACLDHSTICRYLEAPDRYEGLDTFHVLPEGPPTNPDAPLPPDSVIMMSHTRCSDFDLATAARNPAHARQFFRWHEAVRDTALKDVLQAGAVVHGKTHDISPVLFVPEPHYSLDSAQIPADTQAHIDATRRPSPLVSGGLDSAFAQSEGFDLLIDEPIVASRERTMCTVYRCHLVALDGTAIESSPPLCLKLFDDRLQTLRYPLPEEPWGREWPLPSLLGRVQVAEQYALDEKLAYDKMEFVQGSLVPWFFGMHRFTLPDGVVLHGLIMEFIEGCTPNSDLARGMSVEQQIQVIQSARHGSRILDLSDIAQHDWHAEQMLLVASSGTELSHIVMLDFASSSQTIDPDDRILLENQSEMLSVLSDERCGVHLDEQVVWKHFGEPDHWDGLRNGHVMEMPGAESRWVTAKKYFDFTVSPIRRRPIVRLPWARSIRAASGSDLPGSPAPPSTVSPTPVPYID